jgi:predicted nucleic acid-binding protein
MIYVDTSVVVASLDASYPSRSRAAAALLDKRADKVVSELFVVELAAAISRKAGLMDAVGADASQRSTVLLAYLVHLMSKFSLKLLGPSGDLAYTPLGRLGAEAGSSLGLATDLKLRTLDLLHLAHLLSLKERGFSIEALLTSDREFLKAEKLLGDRGVRLVIQKDAK